MSKVRTPAVRNETCRQVLRSTARGDRIRLRLSNSASPVPLALGAMTIALRRKGSSVDKPLPLLVAGTAAVTIPAGHQVTTDPVAVSVAPGSDIAVSFAITGTAQLSEHAVGAATGWCTGAGTGDRTRDVAGTAFRHASREGLVVEAMEVEGPPTSPGTVLAVGDSLTDPPLPPDSYQRWTDVIASRSDRPVANIAIGGNRVVLAGGYGPTLDQRFASDVLGRPGADTLVLFAGTNDVSVGIPAPTLVAELAGFCRQSRRAGLHVVLVTLVPAGRRPPAREAVRQEVNAWIRTTADADGWVDADALLKDPANPSRLRPSYDLGDGLHLSAAGHLVLGEAVARQLR